MMSSVVLLRHGESVWNAQGLWTGTMDVPMTERGLDQVQQMASLLADQIVHVCHTSTLSRAQQTLEEVKRVCGWDAVPTFVHPALNERDYGILTGKNKWQVQQEYGEVLFHQLRRGWNCPIPDGETLKEVHQRVVAYWQRVVLPDIQQGRNSLIAFHGNSMRALVKHLDGLSDEEIPHVEIGFGEVYIYTFDQQGVVRKKEIRCAG